MNDNETNELLSILDAHGRNFLQAFPLAPVVQPNHERAIADDDTEWTGIETTADSDDDSSSGEGGMLHFL